MNSAIIIEFLNFRFGRKLKELFNFHKVDSATLGLTSHICVATIGGTGLISSFLYSFPSESHW